MNNKQNIFYYCSDIIKIRQEVLNLMPTFNITSIGGRDSGRSLARIKQNFTMLNKKFSIDSVYGEYVIEATGTLAHSFTIAKGNQKVATIKKKYLKSADTYSVEITDDENHPFLLALVIVINQVLFTFHWQKLTVLK